MKADETNTGNLYRFLVSQHIIKTLSYFVVPHSFPFFDHLSNKGELLLLRCTDKAANGITTAFRSFQNTLQQTGCISF